MTLQIHYFTYHLKNGTCRYNLKVHINKRGRLKALGYYPQPKESIKKQIRERDNYTCQLCGRYSNNVDHIIPLRISHDNSRENLRVLCFKCNTATRLERRDTRPALEDWYQSLEDELNPYLQYT